MICVIELIPCAPLGFKFGCAQITDHWGKRGQTWSNVEEVLLPLDSLGTCAMVIINSLFNTDNEVRYNYNQLYTCRTISIRNHKNHQIESKR